MSDQNAIRDLVARIAGEVLEYHRELIERDIAERLEEEYQPPRGTTELTEAAAAIRRPTSQAEILEALLNGIATFAERCGLLIVRGTMASGWQARGIANDVFRRCSLDCSSGEAARATHSRGAVVASPENISRTMASALSSEPLATALLVPVVIRDRVVALVYGEHSGEPDTSAIEMLVHTAEMWLEIQSFRKNQPAEAPAVHAAAPVPPATPVPGTHVAPSALPQPAHSAPPPVAHQPAPVSYAPPPAAPEPVAANGSDHPEIQEKARRFAKLLVEEIKLYNQPKVAEGRLHHDLLERLRVDIQKSREAYDKRFGALVPQPDFFTEELVRILAHGDPALLGGQVPR